MVKWVAPFDLIIIHPACCVIRLKYDETKKVLKKYINGNSSRGSHNHIISLSANRPGKWWCGTFLRNSSHLTWSEFGDMMIMLVKSSVISILYSSRCSSTQYYGEKWTDSADCEERTAISSWVSPTIRIKPKTGRIFLKRFLGGGWRELVCGWMDREWTVIFVLLLFTFFNISAEKSSLDPRTTVTFWDGQMMMMTRSRWSDTIERAVA